MGKHLHVGRLWHAPTLSSISALGVFPPSSALTHVASALEQSDKDASERGISAVLSIGARLPPVPHKLVTRIQAGEFVDMSKVLPGYLGVNAGPQLIGD